MPNQKMRSETVKMEIIVEMEIAVVDISIAC